MLRMVLLEFRCGALRWMLRDELVVYLISLAIAGGAGVALELHPESAVLKRALQISFISFGLIALFMTSKMVLAVIFGAVRAFKTARSSIEYREYRRFLKPHQQSTRTLQAAVTLTTAVAAVGWAMLDPEWAFYAASLTALGACGMGGIFLGIRLAALHDNSRNICRD